MNKKNIIIMVVIGIVALAIGFGSAYAIFGNKKCEEIKCNSEEKDKTNIKEDNNDKVDKDDDKNDKEAPKETDIDKIFLSTHPNSYNHETLIFSSDSAFSINYMGAMHSTNISDEYKASHTVYRYLNATSYELDSDIANYIWSLPNYDSDEPEVEIKLSTLNKMVSTFFANTEIKNGLETEPYAGVVSVKCNNDACKIKFTGYGSSGYQSTYCSHVDTKIYNKNTDNMEYVVSSFYLDNGKDGVAIYTEINGELVKEVEFNEKEYGIYDNYKPYVGDKQKTYKYIFNSNDQLVSIEEIK